jgi:membrane fusion protein (multidrug efflux system)
MTKERRITLTRRALAAAAVVLVAGLASIAWVRSGRSETTDDAQIEGHLHAISARVTGTVVRINPDVQNNHYVKAGTLLVELDPTDYDVALEQARATLTMREAAARASAAEVPITRATAFSQLDAAREDSSEAEERVAAEEANLSVAEHRVEHDAAVSDRAERDRQRYLALVEKREISRSEYDARESDAKAALETLEADRAAVRAALRAIAGAKRRVAQKRAEIAGARSAPDRVTDAAARSASAAGQVRQAAADVHAAELNLRYTKIYAPVGGIVGRKTVEVGHRVEPGQTLLVIVPVDDIWVTANFKETQVKRMRPGQAVRVYVDAFRLDYAGTVEDMPAAAGTLFSLLPPENASGNFVKVVQRLPVRIRLNPDQDPEHQLRPGMSAEARVRLE